MNVFFYKKNSSEWIIAFEEHLNNKKKSKGIVKLSDFQKRGYFESTNRFDVYFV